VSVFVSVSVSGVLMHLILDVCVLYASTPFKWQIE
jgi:hypothetical protein